MSFLHRILTGRSNVFGSVAVTVIAAVVLSMVSILTFRIAEGFTFSLATLTAGALVYTIGFLNHRWN